MGQPRFCVLQGRGSEKFKKTLQGFFADLGMRPFKEACQCVFVCLAGSLERECVCVWGGGGGYQTHNTAIGVVWRGERERGGTSTDRLAQIFLRLKFDGEVTRT